LGGGAKPPGGREGAPVFGRYQLLSLLGKGGTAKVYRALRPGPMGFGKEVALKIIEPDHSLGDEPMVSLANEARLGCLLRHPNIVSIDEFDTVDGAFYIAMEYVEGWPLERLLRTMKRRREKTPLPVVLQVLLAVCDGLAYAHELADKQGKPLGIVHRDLKPGNVMVSRRGEVKVADFGTAKASTNIKQTQQGFTRGTPAYMSPEQVGGKPLDCRSDLFSVGLLLHELATLEMAFEGEDIVSVMQQVLMVDPREVSSRLEDIAPGLVPIMRRCLARDPDDRYQSARAVGTDLRKVQEAVGLSPSVAEWVDRLGKHLPVSKTGEFGWDAARMAKARSERQRGGATQADTMEAPLDGGPDLLGGDALDGIPDIAPDSVDVPAALPGYDSSVFGSAADSVTDWDAPTVGPTRAMERPHLLESGYEDAMETLEPPMTVAHEHAQSQSVFLPPVAPAPGAPAPPRKQSGPAGPERPKPSPRKKAPPPPPPQGTSIGPPMAPRQTPARTIGAGAARLRIFLSLAWKLLALYAIVLFVMPSLPGKAGEFMAANRDWQIGFFNGVPAPPPWEVLGSTGSPVEAVTPSALAGDLVALPGGKLRLGEPGALSERIEVPPVEFLAREVTVEQYQRGCSRTWWQLSCPDWDGPADGQKGRHPAVRVTWQQARDFCAAQGLRLPTEAEWEYAARGPKERKFPWGAKWRKGAMNYCDFGCTLPTTMEDDGFERTAPVGRFPAGKTPEGLYDMSGNVAEWTLDCWTEELVGRTSWHAAEQDDCPRRVARGGSFNEVVDQQTGWRRLQANPDLGVERIGFRCVKGEDPYGADEAAAP